MLPPLRRRCPRCEHRDWAVRFRAVHINGARVVVCPVCDHRFETVEKPWLN